MDVLISDLATPFMEILLTPCFLGHFCKQSTSSTSNNDILRPLSRPLFTFKVSRALYRLGGSGIHIHDTAMLHDHRHTIVCFDPPHRGRFQVSCPHPSECMLQRANIQAQHRQLLHFEYQTLPFHEVSRLSGNRWFFGEPELIAIISPLLAIATFGPT